jgi:hypothetical protein
MSKLFLRTGVLALVSALSLGFVHDASAQDISKKETRSLVQLSDAELFASVFYGDAVKEKAAKAEAADVVNSIRKVDAEFLERFRKLVTSGDHEAIELAITETLDQLSRISKPGGLAAGCVLVCWSRDPRTIYERLGNDSLYLAEFTDRVATQFN